MLIAVDTRVACRYFCRYQPAAMQRDYHKLKLTKFNRLSLLQCQNEIASSASDILWHEITTACNLFTRSQRV